jgi:hypothetical protein
VALDCVCHDAAQQDHHHAGDLRGDCRPQRAQPGPTLQQEVELLHTAQHHTLSAAGTTHQKVPHWSRICCCHCSLKLAGRASESAGRGQNENWGPKGLVATPPCTITASACERVISKELNTNCFVAVAAAAAAGGSCLLPVGREGPGKAGG